VIDDDEIVGVSVSPRDQDDIVMIWNTCAKSAVPFRMFEYVNSLVPAAVFNFNNYKRKISVA